jgi:hypothetical protein
MSPRRRESLALFGEEVIPQMRRAQISSMSPAVSGDHLSAATIQEKDMRAIVIALAFAAGMISTSLAQTWPTHPIRLVVNFPPGGAADLLARLIGQSLG